ncbi:hypothetical protein ACFC1R_21480 [Kitasatospora sp. NPDC056138]|uniref:hypothetical protein n=1 Tax=Kitasatospora sp. NPDC056138 TaxID=3345724 RepID=UPI0035DE0F95
MQEFHEHRRATAWARKFLETDAGSPGDAAVTAGATAFRISAGDHLRIRALEAGRLYRHVQGIDHETRPMTPQELAELGDPMAALLFRRNVFPMTVQDLLAALPQPASPSQQAVYLISEAGQIPPGTAPGLHRDIRFAIARSVQGRDVDLLISTGANADPATTFLQVAAWDPIAKVFNYYMRITPAWVWAGNSWSALAPGSRGNGCFDSHVNGSVVMKELKQPWPNWQSQAATIQLAPDDPLRKDPLYQQVSGAQDLELTVRSLVSRWTAARLAAVTVDGTVEHPDHLMRHLFTTTSVNLTSSATQSATITAAGDDLPLPPGLWLNTDALLDDLALPTTASLPLAPASLYVDSLTTFGFRLEEKACGFSRPGDTFFAFVTPEAAYEDNDVVRQLVQQAVVPAKFAACALMVDFTNPVFSTDRARLMAYVPTVPTTVAALTTQIVQAILAAAAKLPATSPEARFAAAWDLPDSSWAASFAQRIDTYLGHVGARIRTPSGFDDYVRLAESRRREFKAMRLNEFELTLPVTDIPSDAPRLTMLEDATLAP